MEGVTTEKVTILGDSATVQCFSLHLTSFACLVDVGGAQVITVKHNSLFWHNLIITTFVVYNRLSVYIFIYISDT